MPFRTRTYTSMSFTTYSRTVSAARADWIITQPNQFTSNDGTAESETKVITVGFEERDWGKIWMCHGVRMIEMKGSKEWAQDEEK